ncbi:ABC transporter permease [Chthonomonas calidirosea]|uniref:ABC transporter permease n=1 Tax=Chthonomonas calidirosea TaxID=454171 RepID=UPI0006EC7D09|nr:ABC transporter permease [Chthonomonas calidirosea]CEK16092.1 ABC-type antimicrobial peptide transport system, permease component [Chthonomonas calidirosea]
MNLLESTRIALRGLAGNKMRTFLTMLGIIIGVGVVILVVAIGEGATQRVKQTIDELGTNLLFVWNGPPRLHIAPAAALAAQSGSSTTTTTSNGFPTPPAPPNRLTLDEANAIAKNFTQAIAAVAPIVRRSVQIRFQDNNATTTLQGTNTEYPFVNNASVMRGRFFDQSDIDGVRQVCVVGQTVVESLTGSADNDLVGQHISINNQDFLVIGELTPKGSGIFGQDQDDVILAPITTVMQRIANTTNIDAMNVRCTSAKMMPLAMEQIANYLRNQHHLQPPFPQNDDFEIRSQTDLMNRQQSVTGTMTSLLSIVAIISLVVGGIGIMNIMLVSVTERTREIGIRKAIGATPRDILLQFLIESSIISLIGGIIGLALGVIGAHLLASVGGWNTIVDPRAVIAGLVVSAGVGLFFGIYPASKAAALNPIEALRFE